MTKNNGSSNLTHFKQALEAHAANELRKRIESADAAEENRQADIRLYNDLLDRLVSTVAKDHLDEVREASQEGKRTAELYIFDGAQKFEDTEHSILFLTKGPRRQGQDFFLKLGILPFLARLYQVVHPFDVDLQYVPEANENIISLSW